MEEQHSMTVAIVYSIILALSSVHAIYIYEKTRRTDAGTPEKISVVHSIGTSPNPASLLSLEEVRNFSLAFRGLLAYRDKGYVSLMHVQAQIGQA